MPRTLRIVKPRIVKPASARQRENGRRWNHASPTVAIVAAPPETMPTSSWWTGVSRDELRERVVQERPRIALSRFGRLIGSGVLSPE
jgi:hypothetical protein